MERIKFASLIGAGTSWIRWGRPMLLFASLFFSDISYYVIQPIYSYLTSTEKYAYFFLAQPISWTLSIINYLLLAFLLLLVFRWIRNDLLAVLAATLSYILLRLLVSYIFISINYLMYPTSNPTFEFHWARISIFAFIDTLTLVGGIVLALLVTQRVWLAVLIGAIVNYFATQIYNLIYGLVTATEPIKAKAVVEAFGFGLLAMIIFFLVYAFGWWMTTGKTDLNEAAKPRLSKEFFVGTWFAVILVTMTTISVGIVGILKQQWDLKSQTIPIAILFIIVNLLVIYGVIVYFTAIYRMWAAIQDGYARTSPGQAVGFMFIPIYSLYWIFQILPGYAEDYNQYIERYKIAVPYLESGIFRAYCILTLLTIIPFIGILFSIVNLFVGTAMLSRICDAVNALPETNELPLPPSPPSNLGTLNLNKF